jgi:hypothetical protein
MKTFFLVALPVHATAIVCNGTSTVLPQAQCEAWVDFFDAANGAGWIGCMDATRTPKVGSTYRTDPCGLIDTNSLTTLFCDKGGTTIQKM